MNGIGAGTSWPDWQCQEPELGVDERRQSGAVRVAELAHVPRPRLLRGQPRPRRCRCGGEGFAHLPVNRDRLAHDRCTGNVSGWSVRVSRPRCGAARDRDRSNTETNSAEECASTQAHADRTQSACRRFQGPSIRHAEISRGLVAGHRRRAINVPLFRVNTRITEHPHRCNLTLITITEFCGLRGPDLPGCSVQGRELRTSRAVRVG